MKRALIIGGALACTALLFKRLKTRVSVDWEKRLAAMPDTAPPKWMFMNITAIRANTDRILELLEAERTHPRGDAR